MLFKRYTYGQTVFTLTIFLSACLLFFIQPLFAKIVLPILGGSPSVWTTAMLFFQSVLVIGYVYAHLSTKYLPVGWQVGLHFVLWACALTFMPISVHMNWISDPSNISTGQTLLIFAIGVGIPFAVLSANAPLIQKWYSMTNGPSSDDPYFLYSASNVGSLLALLAFPFMAEPLLGASAISKLWSVGFITFGGFLLGAGYLAFRSNFKIEEPKETLSAAAPNTLRKLYWIVLAAIPSSMMLSVTTKVSTDFGSFPLIWIIPLSLYLITFIYAFSGKSFMSVERQNAWVIRCLVFMLTITIAGSYLSYVFVFFGMMIAAFFFIALVAHKRIYDTRPNEKYLTQFYILISIGGVMGGFFNSVVAPNLFNDVYEMPIVIALTSILLWSGNSKLDLKEVAVSLFSALVLVFGCIYVSSFFDISVVTHRYILVAPVLMLVPFFVFKEQEWKAIIWISALILTTSFISKGTFIFQDRSFFGVHRVYIEDGIRVYSNGTTVHGAQLLSENGEKPSPITYYNSKGPMGQIFTSEFSKDFKSVGIVGLGVGSLTCYKTPEQDWHLYEIDKIVDDIARNKDLFTFMSSCAGDTPTYLGDARLVMNDKPDGIYDVLVIDAFSSDAVPVHLLTLEALQLYMSKLKPDGILVLHVSNRFFSLGRPISFAANHMGLEGLIQAYSAPDGYNRENLSSLVITLGKPGPTWAALKSDTRWKPLKSEYSQLWTDDYANLLSVLQW